MTRKQPHSSIPTICPQTSNKSMQSQVTGQGTRHTQKCKQYKVVNRKYTKIWLRSKGALQLKLESYDGGLRSCTSSPAGMKRSPRKTGVSTKKYRVYKAGNTCIHKFRIVTDLRFWVHIQCSERQTDYGQKMLCSYMYQFRVKFFSKESKKMFAKPLIYQMNINGPERWRPPYMRHTTA